MKTRLFYLHALTPLHVGVGQAIGVVDLPIMRERSTQLPIVPGSTLKGVLRDEWALVDSASPWAAARNHLVELFGPDNLADNGSAAHAGALAFGDARPLLLPVRSLGGVVAWITCPFVLKRYARDAQLAGVQTPALPTTDSANQARVATNHAAVIVSHGGQEHLVLEELELPVVADPAALQPWVGHLAAMLAPLDAVAQDTLDRHLALVPDDDFAFLAETATEVRARVRIDDQTRTVKEGALWYEENLPCETVLWGVIGVGPARRPGAQQTTDAVNALLPAQQPQLIQMGGKQTVGRGLCRWMLA